MGRLKNLKKHGNIEQEFTSGIKSRVSGTLGFMRQTINMIIYLSIINAIESHLQEVKLKQDWENATLERQSLKTLTWVTTGITNF